MKKYLIGLIFFSSFNLIADSGTLQNMAGGEIDLSSKIVSSRQLNLDNPFVIQLFATWKSLGRMQEASSDEWIELILDKQYEKALLLSPSIKESKIITLKRASDLYLLFRTGNVQTFLNEWIELASSTTFLETELGIALDQVVGLKSTELLISNGFYISPETSVKLKKISGVPSRLNYSLQAFNSLRTRENAVTWLGKLNADDPLRMPLAQTALLFYAKEGKLGASGKILKDIVEPILKNSSNEEELSLYFITLGRLLYQAGALAESKKYYDLIPESSSYFLKAKTEALWIHLREKNYSRTKGELATLELAMFSDKFYPEAYLVSAMANVLLCQFVESRAAINRFIEVNRGVAKEIEMSLADSNAKVITTNFYIENLEKAKLSLLKEKEILVNNKYDSKYLLPIDSQITAISNSIKAEIHNQWVNKKTIIETALYKMKFVKIELISRMRQVEMNMRIAGTDEVSQQSAATARTNQMSFPRSGALWGDELFHMSASVKNKCIKGELK
jgi:hypothetical protein